MKRPHKPLRAACLLILISPLWRTKLGLDFQSLGAASQGPDRLFNHARSPSQQP